MSQKIRKNIIELLKRLKLSFKKYLPKLKEKNNLISNPFNEKYFLTATITLPTKEKENSIELSNDTTLKTEFKKKLLIHFWIDIGNEYEHLSDKAIKFLLPFTSTKLV